MRSASWPVLISDYFNSANTTPHAKQRPDLIAGSSECAVEWSNCNSKRFNCSVVVVGVVVVVTRGEWERVFAWSRTERLERFALVRMCVANWRVAIAGSDACAGRASNLRTTLLQLVYDEQRSMSSLHR